MVPAGRRKQSKFEAAHHFYKVRDEVTQLMLLDFGFNFEKYNLKIEKFREAHKAASNIDEVTERMKKRSEAFYNWFIDKECDALLEIMRKIECEFTCANSIYPSETAAKVTEYCQRRAHLNEAIANCYALKQEIQYIIRTLPVDMNKFTRFAKAIDEQIALYKGVRQADNRFLKTRKPKKQNKDNKSKDNQNK